MQERKCNRCGSQRDRLRRGLCYPCYKRAWRGTDEMPPKPPVTSPAERVDTQIHIDAAGCWLFTGKLAPTGYASISVDGRSTLVHRFQYGYVGPIPHGLHLDHLCRVRHCCNPSHLEPVTPQENVLRSPVAQAAVNAAKTHCPQGHEYTAENTYRQRNGGRQCKACTGDRQRRTSVSA